MRTLRVPQRKRADWGIYPLLGCSRMSKSPSTSKDITICSKEISRSALSCSFFSWFHRNGFMNPQYSNVCLLSSHLFIDYRSYQMDAPRTADTFPTGIPLSCDTTCCARSFLTYKAVLRKVSPHKSKLLSMIRKLMETAAKRKEVNNYTDGLTIINAESNISA